MRSLSVNTPAFLLLAALALPAQPPAAPVKETPGLPPRTAPTDYQVVGKAGDITIAAEFTGHAVPTAEFPLNSEDHVAVELGLFGPPGAHLVITTTDFSLRINNRKDPLPAAPWALAGRNIKDPEWIPPESASAAKPSKGGLSGGAGAAGNQRQPGEPPPPPPKVPIELLRDWQQRLRRAALPEGDRALPQAGVLVFPHRGKAESIRSVELIYNGPAGEVTLRLR